MTRGRYTVHDMICDTKVNDLKRVLTESLYTFFTTGGKLNKRTRLVH